MAKQILIVEDDSDVVGYIEHLLKSLGYGVCAIVSSGEVAMQKAAEVHPDLALVDMMLAGDMDGIAVAEQMRARFNIPVVYLTAYVDQRLLKRAQITEAFGYVLKPFAERRLHLNIEIALYRHEMERKFKESEQWLSTILRSIGDAVIATNENGYVQFINSVAEDLTGWSQEDAFGKDLEEVFNVVSEDTDAPIKIHIMEALRGRIIVGLEEPNILAARDGKETPIDYSAAPIRNDKKTATGVVLVFRNITRRKEAEEALRLTADALQSQTRILQSILDSMGDGVIVADENGRFLFFNPEAEGLIDIAMGTTLNELPEQYGLFLPDTITPYPSDEFPLTRAIHGEFSDNVEMFIRNENVPQGVYIEVAGRPLQDELGKQRGGVIVFRDVTERKRTDEALARAYTQGRLEIVDTLLHNIGNAINSVTIGIGTVYENLVKNRLTSRLRALANAIEGHQDDFGDYVKNDPQGQKVAPFIIGLADDFMSQDKKLAETVSRVQDRAEHIADIVRMQKSLGRSSVYRKDVNLQQAIDDAITVLAESIKKRDIEIHVDCKNTPEEIRTQESQFHQMLVNLIKNSVEAID
ncbi:PAS domain S-box protein, partial [Candidatus Poribacteria bacterium]|nr:PAS domain S-box protein [Candidatus Poribacteria bacterium]